MPKVCLITLQPVSARVFLVPHMRRLAERGYDVHLVTSPGGEDGYPDVPAHDFFTIHRIRLPWGITPVDDLRSLVRLYRHFREQRYDLVHAHMTKCAYLAMPAAWLARVPLRLYTNHGMAFMSKTGWWRQVLRTVDSISCRFAHRVYYVSFSNRDAAVAENVVDAGKAAVLAQGSIIGLDAARFAPTPERVQAGRALRERLGIAPDVFVVGHIGRAVAHKGYFVTTGMWKHDFAAAPDFHLLLLGSSRRELEDAMGTVPPNVTVVEWADAIENYYQAMDTVIMPSMHEGLGYTLLEGNAAGLPVIGSRISGILDAVDEDVTGLLVPPGDEASLAAAIRRLRDEPELARRLGQAGRERVTTRYEPERVFSAFVEEYDRLTGRGI